MADYKDLPNGRRDKLLFHDEGDGTFPEGIGAHLRGWDSTDGAWYRLPVDHASGALKVVATLATGSLEIGTVDQGAAGATAWPVSLATLPALTAGSAVIGHVIVDSGAVAATLAAETTKVIGVTRSADGAGNLLTSTANALDINIKSGNPTSITANAGTNLNTSALALDATLTGGTQISRAQAIYNATQPSPADTGQLQLQLGARGSLRAELFNAGGTIGVAAGVSNTDGQGNSNALVTLARGQYWNPTGPSWDLARGNFNTTTGDTGAKAANFLGATQTNYNARGAVITILIGTVTGTTPTLQAALQFSYDGGTTWLPMTALGASITPASGNTVVWNIYPGIGTLTPAASGGVAVATQYNYASMVLPRTWRIALTIGGSSPSITITSVNVNYIL